MLSAIYQNQRVRNEKVSQLHANTDQHENYADNGKRHVEGEGVVEHGRVEVEEEPRRKAKEKQEMRENDGALDGLKRERFWRH